MIRTGEESPRYTMDLAREWGSRRSQYLLDINVPDIQSFFYCVFAALFGRAQYLTEPANPANYGHFGRSFWLPPTFKMSNEDHPRMERYLRCGCRGGPPPDATEDREAEREHLGSLLGEDGQTYDPPYIRSRPCGCSWQQEHFDLTSRSWLTAGSEEEDDNEGEGVDEVDYGKYWPRPAPKHPPGRRRHHTDDNDDGQEDAEDASRYDESMDDRLHRNHSIGISTCFIDFISANCRTHSFQVNVLVALQNETTGLDEIHPLAIGLGNKSGMARRNNIITLLQCQPSDRPTYERYVLVTNVDAFLGRSIKEAGMADKHQRKLYDNCKYYCAKCLEGFSSDEVRNRHKPKCVNHAAQIQEVVHGEPVSDSDDDEGEGGEEEGGSARVACGGDEEAALAGRKFKPAKVKFQAYGKTTRAPVIIA